MQLSQQTQVMQEFIRTHVDLEALGQSEAASVYQELIDVVLEHNHRYYIDAKPIISDGEYDELFAYLKKIEKYFPFLISGNSPTQSLIGQLAEGFEKAEHRFPLLSLENSYDAEDLRKWDQRIRKILEKESVSQFSYLLEPKFDGLSVELIYQNGMLVQAITRGDGKVGEDITQNIKTIKNLPQKLDFLGTLRLRGEVMMPKSRLAALNQLREAQ